ncbi:MULTISPECIES: alpha/beta fold hydrolase [Marinobacter]|uniref:Alpha/beta fold hydrolase n=1 Tax=Marinobacter albus TaxID=3030833 RepID=A0ABT7HE76_9GAMM|nr:MULTISPECIES: alpha/beta fold hydrolase [Marinobacter]MBW0148423.1 alpha/beta fold hydrolase [Marinobacter arenosus]MBW7472092.1 alpha/beta fold hydrolase [Marinobacter sp. F4218]MDK9558662.1 alpha/beta fold hydrolase [Marinobacter sp. M216]
MAFLKHNGRTLCYRLLGDSAKPLILMAHPLGMTQGVWDDMLPSLLGKFRVLTWDLPGHGASAAWPAGSSRITPDDLAREALALADNAGVEQFHFVGTSIGGVIGQQLVSQHADRLLSATLTNTGAVIGTADAWNTRSANVLELGLQTMAVDIVPRWFGPNACEQQPALVEGWRVIMGRGDNRSYALLCEMLGRADFREQLGHHQVALALIGGTDDVATPPETLQALAQCSGAQEPVILEGIGHVPSVECPQKFSQMLIRNLV